MLFTLGIGCGVERFAPRHVPLDFRLYPAFLLPLIVLAGFMAWAVWTVKRDPRPGENNQRRVRLLLLTPIAVSVMGAVGVGLVVAVGLAAYGRNGFPFPWFGYVLCLLFLIPPGGTLLWMLRAAWLENDELAAPRDAPRPGDD